jgi:serine/threonine-protein kinase
MDRTYVQAGTPLVDSQTTTAFDPAGGRHAPRPCMALVPGSGPHLTDEVNELLRRRLRVAGLIGLAGFGIFFVRHLFFPADGETLGLGMALQAIVVAVLTLACAVLWSRIPLCGPRLRAIETVMFGTMAAFFAYLQFNLFANGDLLRHAAPDHETDVTTLAISSNTLRWFMLIVLYGTFIPNTWQRCAAVVGGLALTPLVLMFVTCFPCAVMGKFTWVSLWDMTVVLSLGAAIGIFGSYRISALQQQAYQARKLGQYQLHRKLGAGGMGEVYLGEHTLLRRSCAIKLIRPDQAGDPTHLHRFEREVQAMATLTHWNSVEVYDYGHADDGTFYYVMEYLPGLSLQELVEKHGPLPAERAVHFLRQICAALKEAHAIGLIHRDIKPSNVIACQRGGVADVAKLLDFGLVHDISVGHANDHLTMQGAILGSPPYISPEQARGRGAVDARSDIYSLGGLAYFLVTGRPPFVRDTPMELLAAHLHEAPTPPRQLRPELPQELEDVILMCLRKQPDDRFPDVFALDRVLAQLDCAETWDADRASGWWKDRHVAVHRRETEPVA